MSYSGTILVTGGTTGLGYHAALELARKHPEYLIVVASRSDRESAADAINKATKQKNAIFLPLDLSSLTNIRAFAKNWDAKAFAPIQILLLNAALQYPKEIHKTEDGIESTFAITHVGHALLFYLLLPKLAPTTRIVITASGVHDPAQNSGMPDAEYVSAEELAHPPPASAAKPGTQRYTNSKLANVLWTYALQRRLANHPATRQMSAAAFDPGLMPGTGLARGYGSVARWLWNSVLPRLIPLLRLILFKNIHLPAESGANLAWVADSASYDEVAGSYFEGKRKIPSSKVSYDKDKQEDLWEWTARNVAIGEEQKKSFLM